MAACHRAIYRSSSTSRLLQLIPHGASPWEWHWSTAFIKYAKTLRNSPVNRPPVQDQDINNDYLSIRKLDVLIAVGASLPIQYVPARSLRSSGVTLCVLPLGAFHHVETQERSFLTVTPGVCPCQLEIRYSSDNHWFSHWLQILLK